jgi:hypothetical protein
MRCYSEIQVYDWSQLPLVAYTYRLASILLVVLASIFCCWVKDYLQQMNQILATHTYYGYIVEIECCTIIFFCFCDIPKSMMPIYFYAHAYMWGQCIMRVDFLSRYEPLYRLFLGASRSTLAFFPLN